MWILSAYDTNAGYSLIVCIILGFLLRGQFQPVHTYFGMRTYSVLRWSGEDGSQEAIQSGICLSGILAVEDPPCLSFAVSSGGVIA